jgi:Predicted dehydrogenases and related proteins
MDKVRFGIVGIGKMGSIHAMRLKAGLIKGARLAAVCDISPARKEWAGKKLAKVKFFDDYKDMLNSGLIDAVVVATPHYLHPTIAIEAIGKGIHTLIEKPAGVFTSAVKKMNDAAAEHKDVVFGIMYNQRANPLYRRAKELIEAGRLGDVKRINWIITDWYRPQAYYNQGGWRGTWEGEGGGVLINQCPHQLDLFQWLGGMPSKVTGFVRTANRDINVENDVTAYFEYQNGATGVFITSTHDFPGTNRLEIDGDKGQITVERGKLIFTELETPESEFNKNNKKFMPRIPSEKHTKRTSKVGALLDLLIGQHAKILTNFTARILSPREKLIAPGEEGINGLTISNAIHLSGWTGKPVKLPIDTEAFEKELAKRVEEEKIYNKKKEASK